MRLFRNLFFLFSSVVSLLGFSTLSAEEQTPLLKSSVRIIEGIAAADWEQRFLIPERTDILPDHDSKSDSALPAIVPEKKHPRPPKGTTKETLLRKKQLPEKRAPLPLESSPSAVMTSPSSTERGVAPKTPSQATAAPGHRPPSAAPAPSASSKVDKEPEADDDNAEKRKKERREILREERKERDYRNRRIE